jgi:hypothetical protein
MFVTQTAETGVDGDGKCLVNNGGINGFQNLLSLVTYKIICLARVYVDGRLLHIRANVLSKPSGVG